MICFDKLKLISDEKNISNIDTTQFKTIQIDNEIIAYKYEQNTPYSLFIQWHKQHHELVIEFTSKILLDDCIHLINIDTIRACLTNLNQNSPCQLNIDNILKDAIVQKCDVTHDITFDNLNTLKEQIRGHLSNYNKWIDIKYSNNGMVIQNTVSTAKCKKRLIIYDKSKELAKSKNYSFMHTLYDKQKIESYYTNKIRFELNINTVTQIKVLLDIPDNKLSSVLSSNASPIVKVFDEAILIPEQNGYSTELNTYDKLTFKDFTNITDFKNYLVLKECGFDMKKLSISLKQLYSEKTQWTKTLKPYQELLQKIKPQKNILNTVRQNLNYEFFSEKPNITN